MKEEFPIPCIVLFLFLLWLIYAAISYYCLAFYCYDFQSTKRERERGRFAGVEKVHGSGTGKLIAVLQTFIYVVRKPSYPPPTPEGPLPFNGCMTRTWCSRFPEAEHTHILSRTTNRVETWFDKRRWRWKILSFWMTFRFDFLPSPMWTSPNTQRNLCADVYFSFQTAWRKSRGIRHECHPSLA